MRETIPHLFFPRTVKPSLARPLIGQSLELHQHTAGVVTLRPVTCSGSNKPTVTSELAPSDGKEEEKKRSFFDFFDL